VLEAKLAKPEITTLGGGSKQTIGNLFRLLLPKVSAGEDGNSIFITLAGSTMI